MTPAEGKKIEKKRKKRKEMEIVSFGLFLQVPDTPIDSK